MLDTMLVGMLSLKTLVLICHLVGLTLGFGGAMMLDFILMISRSPFQPLDSNTIDRVYLISRFVVVGLVVLWVTGCLFLLDYYLAAPEKLTNQKVWSKVSIVLLLTANGGLIHGYIMPCCMRPGMALFDFNHGFRTMVMIFSGVLSACGWWAALVMGVSKEMNFKVQFFEMVPFFIGFVIVVSGIAIAAFAHQAGKKGGRAEERDVWVEDDFSPTPHPTMPFDRSEFPWRRFIAD